MRGKVSIAVKPGTKVVNVSEELAIKDLLIYAGSGCLGIGKAELVEGVHKSATTIDLCKKRSGASVVSGFFQETPTTWSPQP